MEINSRFLLDLYDGAQQRTPSDFNEYALDEFKKIVYFDSACVANLAVMQDEKIVIQSLHLRSVSAERFRDRSVTVGTETLDRNGTLSSRDSVATNAFAQRGKSVIADIAEKFSSPAILEYCRKYETAHSLSFVSSQAMNGLIPVISLWRAARKNAYLESQAHAATLVIPHIFQAMAINRRLATAPVAGPPGSTTAFASLDGHLFFVEPEATRLLQLEWKQWSPPLLPRSLIDSLKQDKERVFVGVSICMRASVQGKMICLRIAAKENKTMDLTTAEYRVARLAAGGLPYKEIAKQLEVSPATVRNQLHSVYKKLGISSKTALAAVLRP
jgi:DNA-binding CsgD family transcriptional regulator